MKPSLWLVFLIAQAPHDRIIITPTDCPPGSILKANKMDDKQWEKVDATNSTLHSK